MSRVIFDGFDLDGIYFQVRSRSVRNLWYAVIIRRDNGRVICECPDATFRKLTGNIFKPCPCCWHAQVVIARIQRLLSKPLPTLADYAPAIDDRFRKGAFLA